MAKARPYLIPFDGKSRLVEAPSLERAERHVINGELAKVRDAIREKMGEGRCANSIDVIEFYRGGGVVEKEGEYPAAAESLLGKLTPGAGGESTAEDGDGGD